MRACERQHCAAAPSRALALRGPGAGLATERARKHEDKMWRTREVLIGLGGKEKEIEFSLPGRSFSRELPELPR
jgi:hypothetical protein